ncbi:beta-Ala-His dipeptidase [Candidatus Bathyarchaeota archaeon]|nr:beta-Ala-His dipeptidase [Candidatus Bathyarchaeota archaeon]
MVEILEGLEPQPVWDIFEQISRIPRCSKNEAQLQDWLEVWAQENGIGFKKDPVGNVLLTRESTSSGVPSLLLQAHQDMVCEKTPESNHSFKNDPIPLVVSGDRVHAHQTSLGADNGIGMALAMALLVDETLTDNGRIEALFTVDEEAGFTGVRNLKGDFFASKFMINLDSEESGVVIVNSAGGGGTIYTIPYRPKERSARTALRVEVGGLMGGHSGVDIHLPRYNANKLLAEGLVKLHDEYPIRLIKFQGGTRGNAIPRNAFAEFLVPRESVDKAISRLDEWGKGISRSDERGLSVIVSQVPPKPAAPVHETEKMIKLVSKIPFGPKSWSPDYDGLVQTSNNNGIVKTEGKQFTVSVYSRTSDSKDFYDNQRILYELGEGMKIKTEQRGGGMGWKADMNSPLLKIVKDSYTAVLKKNPKVTGIHGGLECGVIAGLKPGMDIVSVGPTIKSPHSPSEYVEVGGVSVLWELLKGIATRMSLL